MPRPVRVVSHPDARGRSYFASADIAAGTVVLRAAPAFRVCKSAELSTRCCVCLQPATAEFPLRRCDGCSRSMLCDRPGCACSAGHADECASIKMLFASGAATESLEDSTTVRLLIRAMLAWRRHEDADEDERGQGDDARPVVMGGPQAKMIPLDDYGASAASLFSLVLELEEHEFDCPDALWGAFEDTAKQLKYLVPASARRSMEEYIGMLSRLYCNAFEVTETRPGEPDSTIGLGLWPVAALFNHSCAPNCVFDHRQDGTLEVTTRAAVPAGHELFISYIDATKPTEQRRAKLLTSYFFVCQCVRCTRLRSKRKWTAISEELVERQAEQGT